MAIDPITAAVAGAVIPIVVDEIKKRISCDGCGCIIFGYAYELSCCGTKLCEKCLRKLRKRSIANLVPCKYCGGIFKDIEEEDIPNWQGLKDKLNESMGLGPNYRGRDGW